MAMGKGNYNQKKGFNSKQFSTETVHLGSFSHTAESLIVLKLESKDIPYPNAPVLQSKKQIGKIEEVFGPKDDVSVAVKLENGINISDFTKGARFEAYKDKFIARERFLPREEVEKRKEQNDKKNGGQKFNKKKGFGDKKRDGKPNRDSRSGGKFDRNSNDRSDRNNRGGNFGKSDRGDFKNRSNGKRDFKNNKTKFD